MKADSLAGVGGGSSVDLAKRIGFLLAGGGRMEDYRGYDKCPTSLPRSSGPRPPEVRLRDTVGHVPRCGARSRPVPLGSPVAHAVAGFDALGHAVETAVTSAWTEAPLDLSRRAFAPLC